jgi:pyridoxamine 5'-phosphate oxidase family protein
MNSYEEPVVSFTEEDIAYLQSQRLARIATVSPDGQPDVVPVGYKFDGEYFYVGGMNPAKTRKFRNVRAGNTKVALVIDDLVSVNPWTIRGLRVYGNAELVVSEQGQFGPGHYMRITPTTSWSWNLDVRSSAHDRGFAYRRAVHQRTAEPGAQSMEGAHDGR